MVLFGIHCSELSCSLLIQQPGCWYSRGIMSKQQGGNTVLCYHLKSYHRLKQICWHR